jgi:predicted nuclease of predicted toxin-antitoxin system
MISIYMDQHVPRAITEGLRLRGVDVITAYEDRSDKMEDSALLDRATKLGRVLFTQDNDLLHEGARRQKEGTPFNGVIYAHQMRVSIGTCIHDLEIISKAGEPEDLYNKVQFLPL